MGLTYIEMGNGMFLNADQVISITSSGYGEMCSVSIAAGNKTYPFHGDTLGGEQACKSAVVALLGELGKHPAGVGLRVITFLDQAVQSRFLGQG